MIRKFFSLLDAIAFLGKIIFVFGLFDALWVFRPFLKPILYHGLVVVFFPLSIFFRLRNHRGENLNRALLALGPIAIKFGQGLSLRADVVGHDVALALASLQDRLPAFSFSHVRKTIKQDFGMPVETMFTSFNSQPIAAASIAGVYSAEFLGRKVAVKILRPRIRQLFLRDVRRLKNFAEWIEKISSFAKLINVASMVKTFEDITAKELNLMNEASSAAELRDNFQAQENYKQYTNNDIHEKFYVPKIFWQGVSENVLTLEWVDGFRLDDEASFKRYNLDKEKLLAIASDVFFLQVFRDGFFHADLHPGNLFFTKTGQIIPIDFGIMGRINRDYQFFLAEAMSGFLEKDYEKVARAHEKIGLLPTDKNNIYIHQEFVSALRGIGEIWLIKNTSEISLAKFLPHLFQILRQFGMRPRTHLLLLHKTIMMAEGLSRQLSTKKNIWQLSEPFMKNWLRKNYTPQARLIYLLQNWHRESEKSRKRILTDIMQQIMDWLQTKININNSLWQNISYLSIITDIQDLWRNFFAGKGRDNPRTKRDDDANKNKQGEDTTPPMM